MRSPERVDRGPKKASVGLILNIIQDPRLNTWTDTDPKAESLIQRAANATGILTVTERTQLTLNIITGLVSPRLAWNRTAKLFSFKLLTSLSEQGFDTEEVADFLGAAYKGIPRDDVPVENSLWSLAAGWTLAPVLASDEQSRRDLITVSCDPIIETMKYRPDTDDIRQRIRRFKDRLAFIYVDNNYDVETSKLMKAIFTGRNNGKTSKQMIEELKIPKYRIETLLTWLTQDGLIRPLSGVRESQRVIDRRKAIYIAWTREEPRPSGSKLARRFGVSNEIISKDLDALWITR